MKNTFLYGFTDPSTGLTRLPEVLTAEKIANVVLTVGKEGTDYDIHSFFYGKFPRKQFRGCPDEIHQKVYPCLLTYLDMIDRYNRFRNRFYPDYFDLFNRIIDFFYDEFTEKGIERIIFPSVMHEGTDVLIYNLAKAMGIKTLMCCPALFPDRFYFTYELEDFGTFDLNPVMTEPEPISIPRRHEKDLFYMQNVKQYDYPLKSLLRDIRIQKGIAWFTYMQARKYKRAIRRITRHDIELSKPYIYFPLHYQPEMTTTGMGGMYVDQMLAIERIARIMPPDWYIYVKENPIQSFEFRGDWFFERMRAIPNLRMLPREMNTHLLTKHSKLVATITGTAGWEAVTGGKPVVIFGRAWYGSVDGVFRYHENLDLEQVARYEIDHVTMEKSVSHLVSKTGVGLIDGHFLEISKDKKSFDPRQNVITVAKSFEKIITYQDKPSLVMETGILNQPAEPKLVQA